MRTLSLSTMTAALLIAVTINSMASNEPRERPRGGRGTSAPSGLLRVGDEAPALRVAEWVRGDALSLDSVGDRGEPELLILTFFTTWSEPSRAALPTLRRLHEEFGERVANVMLTNEPAPLVRAFVATLDALPPIRFARDERNMTTAAYCETAGVGFVPYTFVIGPERRVVWHGHPQSGALRAHVGRALGETRAASATQPVRPTTPAEWEGLFRTAYAQEAWHTALLALNAMLDTDIPDKDRLLRFKLVLLLREMERGDQAHALAEEILEHQRQDARLLNSLAWDILSDRELTILAPDLALEFARAAHRANHGRDADILDTYARALYTVGRVDFAIVMQERAVTRAEDEERERFQRMLSFYEQCRELRDGLRDVR